MRIGVIHPLNLELLFAVAFLPLASRVLADHPNSRAACVLYAGRIILVLVGLNLWFARSVALATAAVQIGIALHAMHRGYRI